MRILVYGAGVVGSQYAAHLHRAGHDVSILARGQRLVNLREHGVVLEAVDTGRQTVARPLVVDRLGPEDAYDLVVVAMRRNRVPEALPVLARNSHTPSVLFLGNNLDGAAPYVAALGRERVLLGFGGVAGVRDGHVIRYLHGKEGRRGATHVGEIDGRVTRRLGRIVEAFQWTPVPVTVLNNVDAWLKTHAALIVPLVCAIHAAAGDNYRLARTRDGIVLGLRGVREALGALRAAGIPTAPPTFRVLEWVPEPLLVPWISSLLDSQAAELAMAGHANAAPDEMAHLAKGLRSLIQAFGVPTPVLDRLYAHLDADTPPLAEGSAALALNWQGVCMGLGTVAVAMTGLMLVLCLAKGKSKAQFHARLGGSER